MQESTASVTVTKVGFRVIKRNIGIIYTEKNGIGFHFCSLTALRSGLFYTIKSLHDSLSLPTKQWQQPLIPRAFEGQQEKCKHPEKLLAHCVPQEMSFILYLEKYFLGVNELSSKRLDILRMSKCNLKCSQFDFTFRN